MTDSHDPADDLKDDGNQEESQMTEGADGDEEIDTDSVSDTRLNSSEGEADTLSNQDSDDSIVSDLMGDSGMRFGPEPETIDISSKWARRYLAHRCASTLEREALSEGSFVQYKSSLREWVNFLHHYDLSVLEVEFPAFKKFLLYSLHLGRRSKTVIFRITVVKQLYLHIELKEDVDPQISPLQFDQIDRKVIRDRADDQLGREDISMEELEQLFEAMGCERNRLSAVVGTETGFRNSDIRNIRLRDIDFDEPNIHAHDPKGSDPYSVPISDELALELKLWIDHGRDPNYCSQGSDHLFPSVRSEKLETNEGLGDIIRDAAEEADIQDVLGTSEYASEFMKREQVNMTWKSVTPHVLRHSFITLLEKEGVPLEYRRLLANHSSTETTQNYSHGKEEVLKEAQSRINIL